MDDRDFKAICVPPDMGAIPGWVADRLPGDVFLVVQVGRVDARRVEHVQLTHQARAAALRQALASS